MIGRLTEKLDSLLDTVELIAHLDVDSLAAAIEDGRGRHAIAIGSGGSTVSSEYFARCRETLSCGPTSVETPMQFVLGVVDISKSDVWLFSAGSNNPDIIAAVRAAVTRRARSLHIVTRSPSGQAVQDVEDAGGTTHVVPVADEKDGYLATHSLIATIAALYRAADHACGDAVGRQRFDELTEQIRFALSPEFRSAALQAFEILDPSNTLILVADPQLRPISVLLETSIWEAGICPVQSTDFRNFAHGRHSWIHHRGRRSLILSLTSQITAEIWAALDGALPSEQVRVVFTFGDGGRFDNAVGIVKGLAMIEAMGAAVRIDPGKPGIGEFGPAMYENDALKQLALNLTPAIRQKRRAVLRRDDSAWSGISLWAVQDAHLKKLEDASFGAIVLDYDGTVVDTKDRYDPPSAEMVQELERLHQIGLRISIATGRGGSAGKALRDALDPKLHSGITMGYYNGAYVRRLDIDIDDEENRPPRDAAIDEAITWLESRRDLFQKFPKLKPGVQITIQAADLFHPKRFVHDVQSCMPIAGGRLKILRSGHSFDIVAASATKLHVVRAMIDELGEDSAVLCMGDSGARHGNDYAILSTPFSISVGEVCGMLEGCWSLFGEHITGPSALLKVLQALVPSASGKVRLDVSSLPLDRG